MRSTAQNATYYLRRETVPVITQTRAENHVHYWIWHQNIAFTWFANSPSWPVSKESCPKNRAQLQRLILQEVKGIGGKFQELTSSLSTSISLSSSLMASPSSEVALPRDIRTCLRKRRRKGVYNWPITIAAIKRSLWLVIGCHFQNNFLSGIYLWSRAVVYCSHFWCSTNK